MKKGPWDDWLPGVLSKKQVRELIEGGFVRGASSDPKALDYSSLDLHLSDEGYALNACVKPFGHNFIRELTRQKLAVRLERDGDGCYRLERRRVYLFKLIETIPTVGGSAIYGSATAKSSVGRMDVLARLIVEGMDEYEGFDPEKVHSGDMFLEITPMTFNVRVKAGISLTQLRLYKGRQKESLVQGDTLLKTVFEDADAGAGASLSVDLSPEQVGGVGVAAFSAPAEESADSTEAIDLWKKEEQEKPKPWEHWRFERTDENGRLTIAMNRFYIIRSREKIHLPKGIAVYCRASDETIGEMRIHYAGFVHPLFGSRREDQTRGTPLIFEVRGHDINVSLMHKEKMARLEFYRMSEDAEAEGPGSYNTQTLQLSNYFGKWPERVECDANGKVTPKLS